MCVLLDAVSKLVGLFCVDWFDFFFSIQVDSLKIALKHLRNENIRLKSQHMKVWWPVHLTLSSYYYKYTQPSVSLEW